jgi:DNA-binding CsgD family transcriptional regulator
VTVNLGGKEIKDVLRLGQAVLSCRETGEMRRAALEILENAFRCDGSNFFLTHGQSDRLDLDDVVTRGITSENMDRFKKYYYRLDPFLRHFPPPQTVMTMEQVAPAGKLIDSEYYNDFLRPQSIHYQMTVTARVEGKVAGVVALFRPKKNRDFSPNDLAKAAMCAPYLSSAMERLVYADRALKRQRAAEAIAAALPCRGVVVADEALNVIYQNHQAEKLMGRDQSETSLPPEIARICRECLDSKKREPSSLLIETDDRQRPVEIQVRRVAAGGGRPLFLISFGPEDAAAGWIAKLEQKGVSRREMEVAQLVLDGLTNMEIGKRLYISLHTVENHLKNIFRKMSVKNRTSLIRELVRG